MSELEKDKAVIEAATDGPFSPCRICGIEPTQTEIDNRRLWCGCDDGFITPETWMARNRFPKYVRAVERLRVLETEVSHESTVNGWSVINSIRDSLRSILAELEVSDE
jgi:hypothetical protein